MKIIYDFPKVAFQSLRSYAKFMSFVVIFLVLSYQDGSAQKIGDPGWVWDGTSVTVNSTGFNFIWKQKQWATAGVTGGIRNPSSAVVQIRIWMNTNRIQNEINTLSNNGGGIANFQPGTYLITQTLNIPKNVVLRGGGDNTVLQDALSPNDSVNSKTAVIKFYNLKSTNGHVVGGIRKMKLVGPDLTNTNGSSDPYRYQMENVKPFHNNSMVNIGKCENIFLDEVYILNSGGSPIKMWGDGGHHTVRDCRVNGAWNKGRGGFGYFEISTGYCLIYDNIVRNLRHFGIQKEDAEFNVVFQNDIHQDVNFHDGDNGSNLIEDNTITISSALASTSWVNDNGENKIATRYAVMGPWSSTQHTDSENDNFVYHNTIVGSNQRCTNLGRLYKGADGFEPGIQAGNNPFSAYVWVGSNKRFYAVKNGSTSSRQAKESPQNLTIDEVTKLSVFPNPIAVNDHLNLEIPSDMIGAKYRVVDLSGRVLMQGLIDSPQMKLQLDQRGLFNLTLFKGDQVLNTKVQVN